MGVGAIDDDSLEGLYFSQGQCCVVSSSTKGMFDWGLQRISTMNILFQFIIKSSHVSVTHFLQTCQIHFLEFALSLEVLKGIQGWEVLSLPLLVKSDEV